MFIETITPDEFLIFARHAKIPCVVTANDAQFGLELTAVNLILADSDSLASIHLSKRHHSQLRVGDFVRFFLDSDGRGQMLTGDPLDPEMIEAVREIREAHAPQMFGN